VPISIITDTSEKIFELVELKDVMIIAKIVATIEISEQSVERNQ